MKSLWVIVLLWVLFSCSSPRIFIVRHAEKAQLPEDNPHLSEKGQLRAMDLASALRKKKIRLIYSTETNRTRETAQPLSDAIGRPIKFYRNDTLKLMLLRIIESGDNALIVGHSNTLLAMLDALPVSHTLTEVADNDYDNLFIVIVKHKNPNGYAFVLKEAVYGAISPAGEDSLRRGMK